MRWNRALGILCLSCSFPPGGVTSPDAGKLPDGPPPVDGAVDAPATEDAGCEDPNDVCCGASEGQRVCVDSGSTGSCVNGKAAIDRSCPGDSLCNAGEMTGFDFVCEPNKSICTACYSQACAEDLVCSPFASTDSTQYCCVPDTVAGGGAYASCKDHNDCASGVCVQDKDTQYCFFSCQDGCPNGGTCDFRDAIIDGITRSVRTCVGDRLPPGK